MEVFIEQIYFTVREKDIPGEFTFVAIDESKKNVSILLEENSQTSKN